MTNPFEQISIQLSDLKAELMCLKEHMNKKQKEKYYSIKEASEILRVSEQTLRRHIRNGSLKAHLLGKKKVIHHCELFDDLDEVKTLKYRR